MQKKVNLTGNKWDEKQYIRYTGYPGGQRFATPKEMMAKHPTAMIEMGVRGMLPKNRLGRAVYRNLYVYAEQNTRTNCSATKTSYYNPLRHFSKMAEITNTSGRRKTAVARIYLSEGTGNFTINGKDYKDYFPTLVLQYKVHQSFKVTGTDGQIRFESQPRWWWNHRSGRSTSSRNQQSVDRNQSGMESVVESRRSYNT
jgi:hypothetical protein